MHSKQASDGQMGPCQRCIDINNTDRQVRRSARLANDVDSAKRKYGSIVTKQREDALVGCVMCFMWVRGETNGKYDWVCMDCYKDVCDMPHHKRHKKA